MEKRPLSIVLYGATGFTGKLVAEALARRGAKDWAIAGRNPEKLAQVRDELELPADIQLITASSDDPASMEELCKQAQIVVTTVGPYQKYGNELVETCARTGTDYVDLNGEPVWMKRMIDAHAAQAEKSGARILFSAGFDSIPSDLSVWFLQQAAIKKFGAPLPRVMARVRRMQGDASGGTMASMKATLKDTLKNPDSKTALTDPFALTEGFRGPDQPAGDAAAFNEAKGFWEAPFAMAAINTKAVHRSNFLLGHLYGEDFVYDEMMNTSITDPSLTPAEVIKQMGLFGGKSHKAGEGPSKEEREAGFYDMVFMGSSPDGKSLNSSVVGDADPGYGSTSKMMAEAALVLAELPRGKGGFFTPASLLAEPLIPALEANAGLKFQIED